MASCPEEGNTQDKGYMGESTGLKGEQRRARENDWGRTSRGGKLAVNGLRQMARGEVGAASDGSLKVLDPGWMC